MTRRYALDATPLLGRRTGIGRYVQALARELGPLLADDEEVVLVAGVARLNPLFGVSHAPLAAAASHGRVRVRRWPVPLSGAYGWWHRRPWPDGSWMTGAVDVFHGTNFLVPPLARARGVVSVHDLAYLLVDGAAPAAVRTRFESSVRDSVRRADCVLTDSSSTADDVVAHLGVSRDRVRTIPLGVDPEFAQSGDLESDAAVARRRGIEGPYVLFVGTTNPRKNLARLVRAFGRARAEAGLPHRLAIVGDTGYGEGELRETAAPWALRIDYVPEHDLPALYRGADAFLFPSLHEGFGLPVLEAMASRTPVLTSNVSSLPEVAGAAALLIDPLDEDALAAGIVRILTDTALRETLVARGVERAKAFSWERCARAHLALYRELAASGPPE